MPWADEKEPTADSHPKVTKPAAHYRNGHGDQRCKNCTMFQPPQGCTAVKGSISPQGLCDYFERAEAYAEGGIAEYSGGSDEFSTSKQQNPYGKHRLDLSIPIASDTELTGRLSAAPNYYGPGRNDIGARVGIRKRFADGGKVGKPRGDFFTVPHDALKALGRGDVGLGHAVLHDLLGSHVMSGKLGTIDPDTVTKLGGGDHAAGRRVLAKLLARIRSNSKPPSGQTIILRGNRANTAINVSKT